MVTESIHEPISSSVTPALNLRLLAPSSSSFSSWPVRSFRLESFPEASAFVTLSLLKFVIGGSGSSRLALPACEAVAVAKRLCAVEAAFASIPARPAQYDKWMVE